MKLILSFFLFSIASISLAGTNILFPTKHAILLIQGQDSDAKMLFDSMNVPAVEVSGVLKKEIEFTTAAGPAGDPVFNLACNYSPLSLTGACHLKVYPSIEAGVFRDSKSFIVGVNDRFAAPRLAKKFFEIDNNSHQRMVFHSINGKFKIYKTFNSSGDVQSFTMEFRD